MPRYSPLRSLSCIVAALVALTAPGAAAVAQEAGNVEALVREVAFQNKSLAKSQKNVSTASDESANLLAEYRAVRKRNEALRSYNAQLQSLLASQRGEHEELEKQIEQVTVISRQITPLMLRMLGALEDLVRVDVPFLMDERTKRVKGLRDLMARADVTESEKFRRVMEAYQIENEYGRTLETYDEQVDINGTELTVHVLRVGRIALLCMTLDGQKAFRWDRTARTWQPLSAEESRDLPKAFRMARKQGAPDLIRLPITVTEEAS